MYLKSLTLKGFKSFADRAHMVFEPGLTVIVGPNGSGKSNVSDAILWVLGEQSAKQLRGQAMEDVVFAGSSARKPVSVAEVDLTLDNSDHVLPVDFDEVVITRRMYRSGESEYLINGAPARLLDVTDILHDSGLGKDTHSIISQGKLDAVLMSRPEDRRALIEEAAGISKHKRRRERAERKLESMDERLRHVVAVQKEIARQLRPLERQVERAQRHKEVSERVAELRRVLSVDDLRRLKAEWARLEAVEAEAAAELEIADFQLKGRQENLEKLQVLLEEKGLYVGDISEQRSRCRRALDRLESATRLLEQKGRALEERASSLDDGLGRSERRESQVKEELESVGAQLDENRGSLNSLRQRSDAANARVRAARVARKDTEAAYNRVQADIRSVQADRDSHALALAKAKDGLENARVQDGIFAARVTQLEDALGQAEREASSAQTRLEDVDARLEAARTGEREGRAQVERSRQGLLQAQKADGEARRALSSAEARVSGLRASVREVEDAAPLAGELSRAAAHDSVRRVVEVLDVPADVSSLVERILSSALVGFVVDGREGFGALASRAASLAESTNGSVEIVDASSCSAADAPEDEAGAPGYALLDRVGAHPGYERLAAALLGGVRVVGTAAEAAAACAGFPRLTFATPQGDLFFAGGRARVGREVDAAAGLLERSRELRELESGLAGLEEAVAASQRGVDDAEALLSRSRDELESAVQLAARLSGERSSIASELARLRQTVEKSKGELGRVKDQRAAAEKRSEETRESLARHESAFKSAEGRISTLNDELGDALGAFDRARAEDRAAHDEANSCQLELARVQERVRSLEDRNRRLVQEEAELASNIAGQLSSRRSVDVMSARVAPLRERLSALVAVARERLDTLCDRASLAEADSATLRKTIEAAKTEVADASVALSRAQSGVNDVKVRKGRLEVQVDAAVKAITSQKGVVLEEALETPAPADRGAMERELSKLEGELAQIGPVNQVALEEYETLRRRADFIAEQVSDLQHARGDLNKITQAIDRKMRSSFLTTFEAVDRNFQEVFSMLFPGGSGHLEMTVPDDPATTGIEVVAQPRGKRVNKMSLLSGGERSLTALGLLFAVYRTRTVPFYVLDEVEAALDDSNLDRMLSAIEELRKTTQLIVISHQRRTMESADVLYGVSMQADGVSRVVSQRLDRAAAK